jgi:hypothetical protein
LLKCKQKDIKTSNCTSGKRGARDLEKNIMKDMGLGFKQNEDE